MSAFKQFLKGAGIALAAMAGLGIVVMLIVVVLVPEGTSAGPSAPVAWQEPPPTPQPTSTPEPTATPRPIGKLPCGHFRNVMIDIQNGVLTNQEAREKYKEVYDDSAGSEDSIREQATRMLRAATPPINSINFRMAVERMYEACSSFGF